MRSRSISFLPVVIPITPPCMVLRSCAPVGLGRREQWPARVSQWPGLPGAPTPTRQRFRPYRAAQRRRPQASLQWWSSGYHLHQTDLPTPSTGCIDLMPIGGCWFGLTPLRWSRCMRVLRPAIWAGRLCADNSHPGSTYARWLRHGLTHGRVRPHRHLAAK
jgi:hypothetical protein